MFDNLVGIIFLNFTLMIFWHLLVLFLCKNLNPWFFSPGRCIYKIKKWEKGGNFYTKTLKIKKWKDKLPQYISKNGFSKKCLEKKPSKEYLERFIMETCRAEWNHFMCCMYFPISFLINSKIYAIIFSLIPIFANLPFLFIQRFNRIRLLKLMNRGFSS